MATFTNRATLTYSGGVVSSNITVGHLTESLTITKQAVSAGYAPGETVTYAVTVTNGGEAPAADLTVTDDLGGYLFDGSAVYPLAYEEGSVLAYLDGMPDAAPAVTATQPLTFGGLTVPAGSTLMLLYAAKVTQFAPLGETAAITNTAAAAMPGTEPVTASTALPMETGPKLAVTKTLYPETAAAGSEITYTFAIQNSGCAPVETVDDLVLADTFAPALRGITASLDGTALASPADYTYDEAGGVFATVPGRITVPAASFVQGDDGSWSAKPGETVLTITGTI